MFNMMQHPFQALPAQTALNVFLTLFVLTLIVFVALWLSVAPLQLNIVAFEFNPLGTLAQWEQTFPDRSAEVRMAFNVGLDFLFIPLYSTLLALSCIWASRQFHYPWTSIGVGLSWAQWGAGVLDIAENVALASLLFGSRSHLLANFAKGFASLKFIILGIGVLYICVAGLAYLIKR
jgi:hypothetical protein